MTSLKDDADHKGNYGVHFVASMFAEARHDFWILPPPERGIDGLVGVCSNAARTGAFAGVQVKCGDSYFEKSGPVLRASDFNFAYWASASIPFIGIVVSESKKTAHWFYLSDPDTFGQRKTQTRVVLSAGVRHPLKAANCSHVLDKVLAEFSRRSPPLEEPDEGEYLGNPAELSEDEEDTLTKAQVWTLLLDRFTAPDTSPEVRANAGHRLSWYFPAVPDSRKNEAKERLGQMGDGGLAGVLDCAAMLVDEEAPHAAELVIDLLRYLAGANGRIRELLARGEGTPRARDLAPDVLDILSGSDGEANHAE